MRMPGELCNLHCNHDSELNHAECSMRRFCAAGIHTFGFRCPRCMFNMEENLKRHLQVDIHIVHALLVGAVQGALVERLPALGRLFLLALLVQHLRRL